ncbi:hypothetical protein J1N10_13705 [Carboxylicivirga sp. A043]|uniref:hypothetical protein n=1 Tax=Carboxylicivirga litoralis TaxID=2816963 RepID=UPI0021CAF0B9|nr:hypothetical protein [Carboxylicivirga sp. A043]MCU4157040.1 hypothetical protein [Carboxylicivirga sp. A043]
MNHRTLTAKDIKELRYQCRMGYIIPFFILLIGSAIVITLFELHLNQGAGFNYGINTIIVSALALLAVMISYLMNSKYYYDIRNNYKKAQVKVLERKVKKKDFEAGSGNVTTMPHNRTMNEFIRYDFIIDNTIYRVDERLYNACNNGDKVLFYYAPKSKYLLGMAKA